MARPRIELHELLVEVLGSKNVYYQPTTNYRMQYPCIVYGWDGTTVEFADNGGYFRRKNYQVTVIDRDPDSRIPDDLVEALPYCSMSTTMVVDNLHQFVFNLTF